jgi:hypothetical protein
MEPEPTLLAIAEVIGTAMIDHGSTVVVRLETPEGNKIALLIPKAVAATLIDELSGTLDAGKLEASA